MGRLQQRSSPLCGCYLSVALLPACSQARDGLAACYQAERPLLTDQPVFFFKSCMVLFLLPAAKHVMACDFMEVIIADKSICNNPLTVWLLLFLLSLLRAAKHVTACDFMEVSIVENRRQHEALGNVSFMVADVTELQQVR
jgi:hypothetical protein